MCVRSFSIHFGHVADGTSDEKSGPGTQVFIDDISTVAQDYGALAALKLVKALLRTFKTAKRE